MNAAHLARRFDRRLRRRPYRAVGDGVVLPREELRRIGVFDGCARLTTRALRPTARSLGSTTPRCYAQRFVWSSRLVRLLLAMHGSHCCSSVLRAACVQLDARFVFFCVARA